MQLQFLCNSHREWVRTKPEIAMSYVENAWMQGEKLTQQGGWQHAIAYLGCAFESVEIMDSLCHQPDAKLLTFYTQLALTLADCFQQLEQHEMSELVLSQAKERLEQVAWWYEAQAVPTWVMSCISELNQTNAQLQTEGPRHSPYTYH